MTHTPEEVASIAAALTKAQRKALTLGHGFSRRTLEALSSAHLVAAFSFDPSANVGWINAWSVLGLAVRQHLMEASA